MLMSINNTLLSKCRSVGSGSHINHDYFYVIIFILLIPKGHYLDEKNNKISLIVFNGSGIALAYFFVCFSNQYILETVKDIFSIKLTSKNNFHGTILSALFTYCIFPDQTWCRVFELFIVCLLANCICDKQTRTQTHKHGEWLSVRPGVGWSLSVMVFQGSPFPVVIGGLKRIPDSRPLWVDNGGKERSLFS